MVSSVAPTLRTATVNDAAAIAELATQLGYPVTTEVMAARLANLPAITESVVVITVAADVVAWMQVGLALSIESEPFAEIRGLVVDEKLRAVGFGSQLVAYAISWAKSKQIASLRVRSNVARAATHAFYEKRGFAVGKQQKVFSLPLRQSN